jgi:O-antigen ligase
MTDIRKGGDLRHVIPFVTAVAAAGCVIVRRDYSLFRSGLFYAMTGYVVISYLLLPLSSAPAVSLHALNREVLPGLFLFAALYLMAGTDQGVRRLMVFFSMLLVFILINAYATVLVRYIVKGKLGHLVPNLPELKFTMHHNLFAMAINILMPFSMAFLLLTDDPRWRRLFGTLVFFSIVSVLLSLSRGGWLSLLVTTACIAGLLRHRFRISKKIAMSAAAGIALLAVIAFLVPTVKGRILKTSQDIGTVSDRMQIWMHNAEAVRHSPFTGWGYGDKIAWDGAPLLLERDTPKQLPENLRLGSHNTFLHILFHQGTIGLAAYLVLLLGGILSAARAVRQPGIRTTAAAICGIIAGTFLVHAMIEIVPFRFICIILGILAGLQRAGQVQRNESPVRIA